MALPEGDDLLGLLRAEASPAEFSRRYFRWSPYAYQEEVMNAILLHGKTRVAWVAGRRVGKTETIANVALQLAVRKPGKKTAIFAKTQNQAAILADRVRFHLQGSPFQRHVVRDNDTELRLRFGQDAHGKHRDSVIFSNSLSAEVRGEGADVLIIDESAHCKSEDFRNKALPYILGRPDPIVIHISTVLHDHDHFMDALKTFPTLPHGAKFVTPSRDRPGVTQESLDEARRSMLDSEFRREYECELVPDGGVFSREALSACLQDYALHDMGSLAELKPKRHHAYYVGVDWAKMKDQSVIAVIEHGTQEKLNPAKLVFLAVYPPAPDNDRHYARVIEDVQRVAQHLGAARVVADASAQDAAERLQRALGKRFEPYTFSAASRDALVDNAGFLMGKRALVLPLEPDTVRQAFANVQSGEKGYHHASRKTKDLFDAIALALSQATTAGEPERRRSMQLHAVGPGSAPIGLGGYEKWPPKEPARRVPYWAEGIPRRYLR